MTGGSLRVVIPAKAGIQALLALFLTLPLTAAEPTRTATETLGLRSSIDRAVRNNPRLQIAQKDHQIAKAQLRQAKSLFFPRASVNLDAVRYKNDTIGLIPPEIGNVVLETSGEAANVQGADNLYIGRLNFVQTLYAGGKVLNTYRLSQASAMRAESAAETMQRQVEVETAEAFFGLLAARETKKLLQDATLDVEKMVKQAGGTHAKLAASAARYDLRRRLSDLDQRAKDLKFAYLKAMGVEYFSDVDVDGKLDARAPDVNLETALVWAKQNRPELKETGFQEEVDTLSVELSLAERFPVLRLGGGVEVRNNTLPLNETNWNAVLDMNIPIFDGLSSPARIRESRYRADQGRLRRSELEDTVDMEVRASFAAIQHWKNELAARRTELADLNAAGKSFVGSRTSEPLSQRLDFLKWRLDRSSDVVDARLELCLATARFSKAIGKSVLDSGAE